jgi:hypothetical protein
MRKLIFFTLLFLFFVSCATIPEEISTTSAQLTSSREKQLLNTIHEINDNRPSRIKAGVTVVGTLNGTDYSADGIAYLKSEPPAAKVLLNDRIFQSPILELLANTDEMKMYFPYEKSAYEIDGNFSDPDIRSSADSRLLLAYSFTAKIPLLKNYEITDYQISNDGKNGTPFA